MPSQLPSRANLARFGAPAAFLAGVTVAVLLIRAGLGASDGPATTPATTVPTESRPATTRTTGRETTATTTAQQRFYTVEAGDTYGSIAAEFDTTVDSLRELNPDVDETQLTIGQRIRVE